jgi:hypothetical protein
MKETIEKTAMMDLKLTKEQIAKGLKMDLQMSMSLIQDIMTDKALLAVIVEYYWNKYLTYKDAAIKESVTEKIIEG